MFGGEMSDTKRLTHPKLFISGPTGSDDACDNENSWFTSFLRLFCRRMHKEWPANSDKNLVKETSPTLFLSGVRVKISNIKYRWKLLVLVYNFIVFLQSTSTKQRKEIFL